MKLLVTGGAGYIGSHTTHLLAQQGHEIVVLDNLVYGHREAIVDPGVELVVGEVGDEKLLHELFDRHGFDAVVHFAAFAYVGESVRDPLKYYANNTAAPLCLLAAMRDHDCRHFVFSSTCATYGEPSAVPITEKEPLDPVNPYGHSKRMLEQILSDCETAFGLRSVCLRYFNACGAARDGSLGEEHDPETHLIPLVLKAARGDLPHIPIFGTDYPTPDGTCVRDYVHVEDLAEAHLAALERLRDGGDSLRCNVGTGCGTSVKEIVKIAEEVTGRQIPVSHEPRRPGDPAVLVADPSLAERELAWTAGLPDVRIAIAGAWAWMESRKFRGEPQL